MLFLIVRHQSVQFTYGMILSCLYAEKSEFQRQSLFYWQSSTSIVFQGLCVALPLVLVSVEPLVWRREDHAVPKAGTCGVFKDQQRSTRLN